VAIKPGKDSEYLRNHINDVSKDFFVLEWSGNTLYCSRENCNTVRAIGAEPWFKPKRNVKSRAKGSPARKQMIQTFRELPNIANPKYHKRSYVESTISAKKRKFRRGVRCKRKNVQIHEELLKWIDYNFTVLSRATYEY
jgi:transposase